MACSKEMVVTSPRMKSALVGLVSAGIDAGLFAFVTLFWAGMGTLVIARGVCAGTSAVFNFLANRTWAFKSKGKMRKQLTRYVLAAVAGIGMTTATWWFIQSRTGWNPRLVHLLSLVLVWAFFTFPVLRRWVFVAGQQNEVL